MCDALQVNWKLPSTSKSSNNSSNNSNKVQKRSYSLRESPTKKKSIKSATKSSKKNTKDAANKPPPKKRGPKPRPRPLPMSKYRRKTANLRERQRMGEINNAFDLLKSKIPELSNLGRQASNGKCEKMTKINVLHVAINYIRALENILDTGDAGVNVFGTAVVQSPDVEIDADAFDNVEGLIGNNGQANVEGKSEKDKKKKKKRPKASGKVSKKIKEILEAVKASEEVEDSAGSDRDSGIMDEAGSPNSSYSSLDCYDCPDWTELTSTLAFPQGQTNAPPPKTSINTLLTESALESPPVMEAKVVLSEDAILKKVSSLQPVFGSNANGGGGGLFKATKDLFRQSSFPDLGEDLCSLFGTSGDEDQDLGFSCMDEDHGGFGGINIGEDPFQLII